MHMADHMWWGFKDLIWTVHHKKRKKKRSFIIIVFVFGQMGEREVCSTNVPQEDGTYFCLKVAVTATDKLSFFSFVLSINLSLFFSSSSIKHWAPTKPHLHQSSTSLSLSLSLYKWKKPKAFLFFSCNSWRKLRRGLKTSFLLRICLKMDEFVNLKETELRLGLPGTDDVCEETERVSCCNNSNKRALPNCDTENEIESSTRKTETSPPRK